MLDSDVWLLIAGLAGASTLLWVGALADGVARSERPHGIAAWIHRAEEEERQEQWSHMTRWLLHAMGIGLGALTVTRWSIATQHPDGYLTGAFIAWLVAALFLGYALPIGLGENYAGRLSGTLQKILSVCALLVYPLLWLAAKAMVVARSPVDKPVHTHGRLSDDDLRALAHIAGAENGTIEEDERKMIAGVFQLGNALAREVMVPRPDIVAVDANTPLLEALTTVIRAGHSRIPVYRDNIDDIAGILYAKDLLIYLRDGQTHVPLGETIRDAYFVPESKEADELLQELQQRRTHIAIVVDEYGGVSGLVTIEDLLEEIVGEIRDEYDMAEEPLIESATPSEVICNARIDLDDLNRQLSISLPTGESDTLGGLIYSRLGRIPEEGDKIVVSGVEATVLAIEGQRITKVKVTVLSAPNVSSDSTTAGRSHLRGGQKGAIAAIKMGRLTADG